jgi:hypothetical protein
MWTRRAFLVFVLLLLGLDFGVEFFLISPKPPPGWRIERWQAGFGSWGTGGYGVAYDVTMPADYDFRQKCGSAWIQGPESPGDYDVKLQFTPEPGDTDYEIATFLKTDSAQAAGDFGRHASDVAIGAPAPFAIGPLRFSRRDLTLTGARIEGLAGETTARGFTLVGENMAVLADLRGPQQAATVEQIVGSLRRARAVGLLDLLAGTIPGLLGC